jgi:outer membrane receptor protein involved in Fe transport
MRVTGTNADPSFENLPGFDVTRDVLMSRNVNDIPTLDQNNNRVVDDAREGMHPVVKSLGVEAKYDIAGFTVTEKFRFSDISGRTVENLPLAVAPAAALAMLNGGMGATLSYANGPKAGQAINPATLNGNGLLMTSLLINSKINSLDNITNDLRASRVWEIGRGKLTATAGFYKSVQDLDTFWGFGTVLQDVVGGGDSALVDVTTAGGVKVTQGGFTSFATNGSGGYHRRYDVTYDVSAPYGSLNYHIGKIAIGGSVRYDKGKVNGTLVGMELGGRGTGIIAFDMNGDGVISPAEGKTAVLPLSQPGKVDYDYGYLSYSGGINFRISAPLAVFARYSVGARAAADRVLFTPAVNYASGALIDPQDGYDSVTQTEVGVKYRGSNLALNLTGFLANTGERNLQINSAPDGSVRVERIVRGYRAYGAEFEGSYRLGQFSVTAGATYTKAEISSDATNPAMVGNVPRHQANFIYHATPRFDTRLFSLGVNIIGATGSFAQDTNQLELPAYTVANAFVQFRPVENVQLMINANNLFDAMVINETTQAAVPASGLILARAMTGRTISASLRLDF